MTAPGFRCSLAALDLGEPMTGTASTVRAFLLVEAPGAWGVDAVAGARLPSDVRTLLSGLGRHGVRVLMIRDHRRRTPETVRVFAGYVGTDRTWVETAELADVRELLDLRLAGLGAGESPGMTPHGEPLFLVCTHGKHDACCAERGRPLCRAMHDVAPEETWEVSHIGGDRFAPNLLVLPHGLYYGRLDPSDAASFVDAHRAGELDLAHLRGRSSFGFRVQAAEMFLRTHTGERGLAAPELLAHERDGDVTRVELRLAGRRWAVRVATRRTPARQLTCRAGVRRVPARQLTCRAASFSEALEHSLVGIEPLDG